MKLSVILPFHIQDSFLGEAIKSCLKALSDDSELILVNTSGTEFNSKMIEKRVYVINAPRLNYIEALSVGIKSANGVFIALMNSDDLVSESRFEKQIVKVQDDKSDLVFCGIRKFKGGGKVVFPLLGEVKGYRYRSEFLLLGSYGANASWLFRSEWARDNDLFNTELDSSDWTTALRVFPNSNVSFLPEKLYHYRMHQNQTTRVNPEKHLKLLENWGALNRQIGLIDLSLSEIRRLTHPQAIFEGNTDNSKIFSWAEQFMDYLGPTDAVTELIERRMLLLGLSSPLKNRSFIKPSVLLRMSSESIWNFTKPRPSMSHNNFKKC